MKLYYAPGACSLSPHIALLEAGLPYDLVKVDLRAKKLENGDDFLKINPKGQVPALALDSGELITEGPVIVQVIADQAADKNLAPSRDHADRYKLQAWLTYINSELHKNLGPQFAPALSDDAKAFFKDRVMGKFKYVDSELAGKDYLMGTRKFVELCHRLEAKYGSRFTPPKLLEDMAAKGETFYGKFPPKKQAA